MPAKEQRNNAENAQLFSGCRNSGRGGRRFKSCHSDQLPSLAVDFSQLSAIPSTFKVPRVHKGVHKHVLRMVSLGRDTRGNYKARKRIPDDVREEYGRLYGPSFEAKFYAAASTNRHEAERQFDEWKAETNARIAAIRAQRKGEGVPLTRQQARALAGEWYDWFLERHLVNEKDWEQPLDQVQGALRRAVGEKRWEENHPDELWEQDEELRKAVRPVLADVGETSQFLAANAIVPNNEARVLFLDHLYKDLAAALKLLMRAPST